MNYLILAHTPFANYFRFQMYVEPWIIFIAGIIFAIRCWKTSAWYFKTGFLCWLISYLSSVSLMIIYRDRISGDEYVYLNFYFVIWLACDIWLAVWVIGFLASRVILFVSKYRKQEKDIH